MFGALFGVIGASIAKLFSVEVLKFVAWKIVLVTLLTVVLPVILFNLFNKVCLDIVTYSFSQIQTSGGIDQLTISLTGLGGWIATMINLPAAFSMIMSAIALRFVVTMIWK